MGRYNEMKLRSKDLRYVEDPSNQTRPMSKELAENPAGARKIKDHKNSNHL